LDKITILSNPEAMPAALKLVEKAVAASDSGGPEKPKRKKRKKRDGPAYLQFEEIARLFKVIASVRDRAIFRLGYHAGLRASEVGSLDVRDYNSRTDRIYVRRLKGSNSGEHHLVPPESRALRAWLKVRGSEPGPIFLSEKKRPISRQMLDVLMKKYGEKAGIPANLRHFHVLKHTCCTHLRALGKNVEDIQDWVGHAQIANTMIYSAATNPGREKMARELAAVWR